MSFNAKRKIARRKSVSSCNAQSKRASQSLSVAATTAPSARELFSAEKIFSSGKQFLTVLREDARQVALKAKSIDLILTSPAYWRKRDYKVAGQIGREPTSDDFVRAFAVPLREFKRVLKPTGSLFLNVGDTYDKRNLADIPSRVAAAACAEGWILRNRIVWVKSIGTPDSARNRLTTRHEFIFHLTLSHRYYYDLPAFAERFGNGANPGDVWHIAPTRNNSSHLAPFPPELAERILCLACPPRVCARCGTPFRRAWRRTTQLNPLRQQARRAMELAAKHKLTARHIAAIQATGISDAGKAQHFQTGAGRNSPEVQRLAAEAKQILGGYFREFTFARRVPGVFKAACRCKAASRPGIVFDPFAGTGTTLRVARAEGFSAIGGDLKIYDDLRVLMGGDVS